MKLRILFPLLLFAIPFAVTACNRAENGGGVFGGVRTPTFLYVKTGENGCADVFLYKTTADQLEYVWVSADKKKLDLPEVGSKIFDLANAPDGLAVNVDLWSSVPKFTPYCNCVTDGTKRETTWKAKAGKVTITLHEALNEKDGPFKRYKASAKLEGVVFEDADGRKATLKEETITEVVVGWYAG